MSSIAISVFVPCYNEEQRLERNIVRIYDAFRAVKKPFELVIVDDGSTDATGTIGKKLSKLHKEIRYVYYANGPSRRENLGKAFRTANGDVIIFMDLDLSVPLEYIPQLLGGIAQGNDIVIGSRYKGTKAKREWNRLFISIFYNVFMRLYFSSKIKDHQCGFKAFQKQVLFQLLDEMGSDKQFIRGWFWDVELLVRAQRHRYKIEEFPVTWEFRKQSSFDLKRELKMLPYVIKLRWKL